jgi:hypothetical protein
MNMLLAKKQVPERKKWLSSKGDQADFWVLLPLRDDVVLK